MRIYLFLIFLSFMLFPYQGHSIQKNNQDSLRALLNAPLEEDSTRVLVLIALAEELKNENPDESYGYIQQGLQISKDKNYPYRAGILNRMLVLYYSIKGMDEKAIESGLRAVRIFDSLGISSESLIAKSQVTPVLRASGYLEKALSLSLENLEMVKNDPETPSKARFYFDAGNCYRELGNYLEAERFYQEALDISINTSFKPGVATIALNLSLVKMELEQYQLAKELIQKQIPYFEETTNNSLMSVALEYLGDIAVKEGRHRAAIDYFEQTKEYLETLQFGARNKELSNKLFIQYSIVGEYEAAQKEKLNFNLLSDSLDNVNRTRIVGELQTKYETEKKETEIASLKQASEIQSLRIRQRNLVITFSLIAFTFVVVVIVIINRQRNAAKRKKQIELEQRFLRSQLNPHFISNALVAVQSSLMENNVDDASTYLTIFSRLMREILENSREEFIPIEDEVNMLKGYLEINKKRLKNQIEYAVDVEDNIDTEFDQVPPMFIQPFIENAIDHGVPPSGEKMRIDIQFRKENSVISVMIKDNGGGLKDQSNSGKRSLSTQIIKERIDLLNQSLKEKITLEIENWTNESGSTHGLKVVLSLPLR